MSEQKDDRLEAARQVLAASLTEEMGFYRPADPAAAAAAYVAGLSHHAVDDVVRENQLAAINALARLIRRGHELGLPPLHWELGSGRNFSGYLVGASLPQPATEDNRMRAFLAWCAVLGVTAIRHGSKNGYADRWHSEEAALAPNVSVFVRYARDWFAEPCSVCSGNLPADGEADDAGTAETDVQEAHKPYIEKVIKALNDAGITTPEHEIHRDDPRSAFIQLGESDPDTGREIGLVWHEESGWYRGIDQNGSGELNLIRWMHDLLPKPSEVVAWVRAMETDAAKHGGIERPRFRDFDVTDDGFEAELAKVGAA